MDVHLKTDAILLSGSSFFSAAVEVTAPASAVTTVVVAMTAAGLSFSFCYVETAAVAVVAAEASAKHMQSKRGPMSGPHFHFRSFSFFSRSACFFKACSIPHVGDTFRLFRHSSSIS